MIVGVLTLLSVALLLHYSCEAAVMGTGGSSVWESLCWPHWPLEFAMNDQ